MKLGVYPDLAIFGKTIANGIPMGAIIGKKKIMQFAEKTFLSSAFWTEKTGPACAVKFIKKYKKLNLHNLLIKRGKKIKSIWKNAAKNSNLDIEIKGIDPLATFRLNTKTDWPTTITYFIQGAGIFLSEILGISPDLAAIFMISLCAFYAALSGLYGVVYTEVFQGGLILFVIIYVVSHVMMNINLPETFVVSVPMGNGEFQQITQNLKDWSSFLPKWEMSVPGEYSQYNLIGLATIMYIFRSSIDGMSGSGGYMIQRFYAAKNEREVGLLSVFWIFLLSFRWPFIMSIAILGISYSQLGNVIDNPETVLPKVLMELFPVGIKGLLVAGLLAAAMSTYVAIVNSGAAYWVNDLYQRFIKPEATNKELILHSRIASVAIVILGLMSTYLFTSLNDVWGFLTMGFGVGLIVPQFIRWYWWRFNGYGYAGGTIIGMITAISIRFFFDDIAEMPSFYLTAAITFVGSVVVSYLFPATDESDLKEFYARTRPFGFWGPIRKTFSSSFIEPIRTENRRDILATIVAVPWMLFLGITPMMVVTKQWTYALICGSVLVILSVLLYFLWYKHLSKETDKEMA